MNIVKQFVFVACSIMVLSCTNQNKPSEANKANDTIDYATDDSEIIEQAIKDVYVNICMSSVSGFESGNITYLRSLVKDKPSFNKLDSCLKLMESKGTYDYKNYKSKGCPVTIKMYAEGPSCVNGWDVYPTITNNSSKTIKYVYFSIIAYNRVGDPICDEYNRGCKWTGPIKPGKKAGGGNYYTAYMTSDVKRKSFTAQDISVEYMDGSKWPEDEQKTITKIASEFISTATKCLQIYKVNKK